MQIAFHIGANCTDEDRLLKSLLKNADTLRKQGIIVPGPGKYRTLIREAMQSVATASPHPDSRDILLDAIIDTDDLRRLVLSNDNFISVPPRIFNHGVFYPQAETKVRALHRLFQSESDDRVMQHGFDPGPEQEPRMLGKQGSQRRQSTGLKAGIL
ncbi:MAG: hypothetical protein ACNA7N_16435, partial [Yoonia sp.]